ncbi:ATP-binding protein [Microbispora sp. NEAU-D428]|uniref:ATP-binding protein n=1 Tax=Microbispora sitophila TaxID=2771537 RepID=UPI0018673FFE|nr:ATP-binding protein [Microbispora sitophila]MBE3008199.1 ATP-binding protein [Microbispora sitophila]
MRTLAGSMLSLEFDRSSVTRVRHLVMVSAQEAGLEGVALEDFVLAVHEAVTNAVRYGSPPRGIAMWREAGVLVAEITDKGPGIPDEALEREESATRFDFGGRGLWLMNRLADLVVRTGAEGTTIRLCVTLP